MYKMNNSLNLSSLTEATGHEVDPVRLLILNSINNPFEFRFMYFNLEHHMCLRERKRVTLTFTFTMVNI